MLLGPPAHRILAICALVLGSGLGCARWSSQEPTTDTRSVSLPGLQLSPDSVVIETVLVRFPAHAEDELNQLWFSVDETVVDIADRKHLEDNGLRAGVLLGDIPEAIREKLQADKAGAPADAMEAAGLAADINTLSRRLQCRAGRRKELQVRREIPDLISILSTIDGEHISGQTFERASSLFDLRVAPHGDGSASVRLTPEIQHGDVRQSFVSNEIGVRPELRREQRSWKDLAIDVRLDPRQILVVAATNPPKSVGGAFFLTQTADKSLERVVLLVRLAETQLDELFAPDMVEQAQVLTEQ